MVETDSLIQYLLRYRRRVLGRLSGHVPSQGELVPQVVHGLVSRTLREQGLPPLHEVEDPEGAELVKGLELPVRRPTLCPGCPHRAAFFAIRKARPKAIFTSDIGCYTLGLNLGVVDTCLDMGAAITMASGFYHAFQQDGIDQPIVATIGDSTFFHSGTAGLLNAVYNGARFILVILDNLTTAMTGMQPTPALGVRADGSQGKAVSLERTVAGCGVDYVQVLDPYDIRNMTDSLKKAAEYLKEPEGGIAVLIARHPCLIAYRDKAIPQKKTVTVTEKCAGCNFCIDRFECPALYHDQELGRTGIHPELCSRCGVCIQICPKGAIEEAGGN
jgi:indolepyruvate ferredoxin oxidoreductase alpha subunit